VDEWTDFTRHFTHVKSDETAKDRMLLLTAILADAINLGLAKMVESCPGTTYESGQKKASFAHLARRPRGPILACLG
jgi:hypothetical protein